MRSGAAPVGRTSIGRRMAPSPGGGLRTVAALVGRNLTIYFRDPMSVFLSLLSAVILLLLYVLFLGGLQVDHIADQLPAASDEQISAFVNSWVFAGIVMITSTTTGLGAMRAYIDDRVTGRFKEFRACPIKSSQLVLGYQIAAFVVAVIMSTAILLIGYVGVGLLNSAWLAPLDLLRGVGLAALESFAFAALSSFLVTFIASQGAFTALSTIVGTVLGFLAGAYLPIGTVSQRVADVINALPFSPAAMLLRDPLSGAALADLADGVPEAEQALGEYYGFELTVGGTVIEPWWVLAGLAGLALIFTGLSALRIGRTIK